MKIEFQDHFDPAYECIYLLTRHFAPPGDMHSVQDLTISLSEKHGIPLSEVEAITGPILEAETHILQHLHVPEETLRSLDTGLLERLTLSVEYDGSGYYISQNNALYLNNWPQANQD